MERETFSEGGLENFWLSDIPLVSYLVLNSGLLFSHSLPIPAVADPLY